MNTRHARGFTVIELLGALTFLIAATILIIIQQNNILAAQRDTARKTAINAMYYNLNDVYYKQYGHYPTKLTASTLPGVDPELFIDPDGHSIGEPDADYKYTASNCTDNRCQKYDLRATLEKEAEYKKSSK